jgi:hypothetical protein
MISLVVFLVGEWRSESERFSIAENLGYRERLHFDCLDRTAAPDVQRSLVSRQAHKPATCQEHVVGAVTKVAQDQLP